MAAVEFRVLGPLDVVLDGRTVDCGGAKQRTLLAALLVNADSVVSVDQLAAAVWGDVPPATATNTIQVYVSALRRCLGPERSRLETRQPGYVVRASDVLDGTRFESLVRDGRHALAAAEFPRAHEILTAALGLWRGPALAEFVYEPFAEAEARRLEELRLAATADDFDARLALGGHVSLVPELEALAGTHPADERLWGQLMLALYRSGRQADALRACGRLRNYLAEQLGIVPSRAIQELEEQILLQRPALDVAPPVAMAEPVVVAPPRGRPPPVPLTSFVGRDAERVAVAVRLERSRLVTITGPGGAGKTRLAVEVAGAAGQDRPVLFADLAHADIGAQVLPVVAEALGVVDAHGLPSDELETEIVRACAMRRRLLLVLDNCEHVIDDAAAVVHRLLTEVGHLTVLATSQSSLRVGGESLVALSPLGVPREEDEPDRVAAAEAVRLFAIRASDHDSDFVLTRDSASVVARICRQLDGMPLAIELAAAQTRAFSLEAIAEGLADALTFLGAGPRSSVERHRTLRAAVDWSIAQLSDAERELLERLAIFTGGFTIALAERICAGDGIAKGDVPRLLAGLVDRSLVIRRSSDATARYWLLETIRQYGWQQLSAPVGEAADISSATANGWQLRRRGAVWELSTPTGGNVPIPDSIGLHHLAVLLSRPHEPVHAVDLAGAYTPRGEGAAGTGLALENVVGEEVIDARARAAYRQRMADLSSELDEARSRNDEGHVARVQLEMDALARELESAVGRGGRPRRAPAASERARSRVTKAIRAATDRLREADAAVGTHLDLSLRTGTWCSYDPAGEPMLRVES